MKISSNLPFKFDHSNADLLNAACWACGDTFTPSIHRFFLIHLALRGMDITRLPQQSPPNNFPSHISKAAMK